MGAVTGDRAVSEEADRQRVPVLRSEPAHTLWLLVSRLGTLFLVLWFYSWFRKSFFQQGTILAFANALDIIHWQALLGLNVELDLQRRVLGEAGWIDAFNLHYRQLKTVLFVAAGLALLRDRPGFTSVWRLFLVTTAIAFPMYALYPLAPPRFMGPYGYPFVDTLATFGAAPNATSGIAAANQYAAMPSMHVAWTAIAALWLAVALPWRRVGAIIGATHLGTMCVTVMVTGNHYVLDIAGGFATVGAAWAILAVAGLLAKTWAPVPTVMSVGSVPRVTLTGTVILIDSLPADVAGEGWSRGHHVPAATRPRSAEPGSRRR